MRRAEMSRDAERMRGRWEGGGRSRGGGLVQGKIRDAIKNKEEEEEEQVWRDADEKNYEWSGKITYQKIVKRQN